jgi:hypothetical protein
MAQSLREQGESARAGAAAALIFLLRWGGELRSAVAQLGRFQGWLIFGGAMILCALAGVVLARRGWRGHGWSFQRRRGPATQQAAALRVYSRMLQYLRSRGLQKASGATPFEFADRVAKEWAAAGQCVTSITELYCRVRFGQIPPSPDDLARAQGLLADLQATPR